MKETELPPALWQVKRVAMPSKGVACLANPLTA
jgi:hypothetical protein